MNDYNNKLFICTIKNDTPSLTSGTIFSFKQYKHFIQASIKGERIKHGELVGLTNSKGIIEYSINIQLYDQQVYGGIGTIKPCDVTGSNLRGFYFITTAYKTFECSFILEKVTLQKHIARRIKTC